MRPVEQQTILITGSTDGLGKALAGVLAARGATVLLHGRSPERLAGAAGELRGAAESDHIAAYLADFASLSAVRALAREIERKHEQVDVLINNAGIGPGPAGAPREESADGHELRFAVNYLAPFLLTTLLLPFLRRGVPARIVNVASGVQAPIDFAAIRPEQRYDGMRVYGQSKLALIAFTVELAERLANQGERQLTVNAVHPGSLMNTKLVSEHWGHAASTVDDGVKAMLHVALAPELEGVSGCYFARSNAARAHPQAYQPAAGRRLWRLSEELVGIQRPSDHDLKPYHLEPAEHEQHVRST